MPAPSSINPANPAGRHYMKSPIFLSDICFALVLLYVALHWTCTSGEEGSHQAADNSEDVSVFSFLPAISFSPDQITLANDYFGIPLENFNFVRFLIALSPCVVVWFIWRWIMSPYYLQREPTIPRASRGQAAANFPPPFPNGWFMICRSVDLQPGQVMEVNALGHNWALFRNWKGQPSVIEAFCPHLGANLAIGGKVCKNGCLRCCFHGWEFDVNGVCRKIEGTKDIPGGADVKSWPTKEVNNVILVWHDAEGRPPLWDVDHILPIEMEEWYNSGYTWAHVNAHVQEIPENGPDAAHLNVLHKPFVWDFVSCATGGKAFHSWVASWQPHPEFKHRSAITLRQQLTFLGWRIPFSTVEADISQYGPGVVRLHLKCIFGSVICHEYVTPLKTTTQMVQHQMYCSPTVPRFIGKFFMWALETQFNRDMPIWEAKQYLPKPVLSKADGPIALFRSWYRQHYSKSSLSFPDALAKESMIDW